MGDVGESSIIIPESIGNYTILGILGSGGMGTVYRGENPHLRRFAAIKVVKSSRSLRGSSLERFQRELIASGKLQHQHIVAAFDGGMFDNRPYLVMELLDGTDLAHYVNDHGPLPVKEACEIIRQVALGLQYVHEAGLVHRDIKPSNLFRTNDETIKILDLGLARLLETEPDETALPTPAAPGETLEGQVLGSPDYMSPEQAVGSKNVDFRSDIYSLGCTFFYLLTGKPPFGETTELLAKIDAHTKIDLPLLKTFRSDVPPTIETLLQRMTSKKVAERPSAVEIVAVIKSLFGKDTIVRYLRKAGTSTDEKRILKRVKFFVSNGADVNAKNDAGRVPIHWAVARNNIKVALFLISEGADVNAMDKEGDTPLHWAIAWHGDINTIQFLVSQGANVNAKNTEGYTPLDLAKKKKNVAVVEYLASITEQTTPKGESDAE